MGIWFYFHQLYLQTNPWFSTNTLNIAPVAGAAPSGVITLMTNDNNKYITATTTTNNNNNNNIDNNNSNDSNNDNNDIVDELIVKPPYLWVLQDPDRLGEGLNYI